MTALSSRLSLVLSACMTASLLWAVPSQASQATVAAAPTLASAERSPAGAPVRIGSAASDFAPVAATPGATAARPARPSCPQCRRAANGSDLMMFWLMFGGVAKTPQLPGEAAALPEAALETRD